MPSFPSRHRGTPTPGANQPQLNTTNFPPGDTDLSSSPVHSYLESGKTCGQGDSLTHLWEGPGLLCWFKCQGPVGDLWSRATALPSPAPRLDARPPRPTALSRWPFRLTQRRQGAGRPGHRGHGKDSEQRAGLGKRELGNPQTPRPWCIPRFRNSGYPPLVF